MSRNVKKLPDGRYLVRRQINGEDFRRVVKTKSDADRLVARLDAIKLGIASPEPSGVGMPLNVAFEHLKNDLRVGGMSDNTIDYYEAKVHNHLYRLFGKETPIDSITKTEVDAYIVTRRAEGVSNGTIKKEITALRTIMQCDSVGFAPRFSGFRKRTLPHQPKRQHIHPMDDYARMWMWVSDEARMAMALGLFLGLREGEQNIADAAWYRPRTQEVVIDVKKTHVWNTLPVVPTLASMLEGRKGKLLKGTRSAVNANLRKVSTALGMVPPVTARGHFRRVCSTYMSKAGHTHAEIDAVLSHAAHGVNKSYQLDAPLPTIRKALLAVEKAFLESLERVKDEPSPLTSKEERYRRLGEIARAQWADPELRAKTTAALRAAKGGGPRRG